VLVPPILIKIERHGGVRIAVSDPGVGFNRRYSGTLLRCTLHEQEGWYGKRLSVNPSIIESHGGHLWTASN
jgi:hypothetical protein